MRSLAVFVVVFAVAAAEQLVSVNQDTLGNYNLKYIINGISRVENRDLHGNVNGGFAYFDPHGVLRKTEFTSGVHGYNAVGTDIPLPVQDTPEVAHAKAAHINTLYATAASLPPAPLDVTHPELFDPSINGALPAHSVALPAHSVALPAALPAPFIPALPAAVHLGAIPDTPEVIAARAQHLAAHAAAARAHSLALH